MQKDINKEPSIENRIIMEVTIILVSFIVLFIVCYFVGSFRESRINKYNTEASVWVNGGSDFFDNNTFNITSANGEQKFIKINTTIGDYYPVRDSCNQKGDPISGCVYTDALFYNTAIEIYNGSNHFIIEDNKGNVIVNEQFEESLTYNRNIMDLRCSTKDDSCTTRCDELGGAWDPSTHICKVTVHANSICYRLVSNSVSWKLDTENERRLPKNVQHSRWMSDKLGCDYGSNWHSVHYGVKSVPLISIELRSANDSYITASVYTRSCSNDFVEDRHCFGPSHHEERKWVVPSILICCCLLFVEGMIVCGIWSLNKWKKQNRSMNPILEDNLLNHSVLVFIVC